MDEDTQQEGESDLIALLRWKARAEQAEASLFTLAASYLDVMDALKAERDHIVGLLEAELDRLR